MSAPFNLGPTDTFDWIGRNSNLDWWNWWNPLQNWRQTVRCMKFILLSIAAMFIKLTVTHFLTLKPYCFWTFRSRYVKILNLTQTERLPNPVLLLFPDSCFDQAGRSLEEKPRNKIYVPNLDRWTPLQNWHQPQVHIFFSWETCDMFISFRTTETETMSILSPLPLENHVKNKSYPEKSFLTEIHLSDLRIKDKHWNWFQKKATKSWKPTSHLVQSLLLKLGGKTWK